MDDATWMDVPGYGEYYEVSDSGFIRTKGTPRVRANGTTYTLSARTLSPSTSRLGYKRVILYKPGAAPKTMNVHRAVMLAFVGDRSGEGLIICHNNGDPADNRLSNLRWGTLADNYRDMNEHGTNHYRNRTHCPRNHLLEEPNLVQGKLKLGHRACRTCHQAASDKREGSLLTLDQLRELRYQMILKGKRFTTRTRKDWEPTYIESGFDLSLIDQLPCSHG